VNKDNANTLSKSVIEKIYKGEMATWPNGGPVVVYDLPETSDVRADFTKSLLGMSVSTVKAKWTVKLFSGKATPPKIAGSDAEMKSAVAANRNAIGYVSASSMDGSVKEALTLR
jgi:ABC-type phosphate transport system substrate-binding protein